MTRDTADGRAFAVWVTGLPASGKSTLTRALVARLAEHGVRVEVLESDALRKILPTGYDDAGRDTFYNAMLWIGERLVAHGVPVVFDATANRRRYRDRARERIGRFIEVHVDVPLEVCVGRDPKGIYGIAKAGNAASVPGVGTPYEPPVEPEVRVTGESDSGEAARRIVTVLVEKGYLKE